MKIEVEVWGWEKGRGEMSLAVALGIDLFGVASVVVLERCRGAMPELSAINLNRA